MEFKKGNTYRARLNGHQRSVKIHIMYILPSIYKDKQLIVFRWYGKYKQWWHEEMESAEILTVLIKRVKE